MARLAISRGLEKAGSLAMGFGQQITQRRRDEEEEEKQARLRKINEELATTRLGIAKEDLAGRQRKAEQEQVDKEELKRFISFINKPEGKMIIQEAFKQVQANQDPKQISQETRDIAPTRPQQLERIQQDPQFSMSQIPEIKGLRQELQTEQERARQEGRQMDVFREQQDILQEGRKEIVELRGEIARDTARMTSALQNVREKGEERRERQFESNRLRQHVKDTEKFIRSGFLIKNIDIALKETGAGGIFGEGDIKATGFGSKFYRKWINSDEGVKVRQAINLFFLGKIKEQSGVAVSDKEFERIETAFGLNARSTMQSFRESMMTSAKETKTQLEQYEKALPDNIKTELTERDMFTSNEIPGGTKQSQWSEDDDPLGIR